MADRKSKSPSRKGKSPAPARTKQKRPLSPRPRPAPEPVPVPVPVLASDDEPTAKGSPTFPIIGIGASAGGLEALEQFLHHVPESSGLAIVVVQHLDPTHKGML